MNILVTALGTLNSTFISKHLKKCGNFIVGVDIYPKNYIKTSEEIDKFYQVPSIYEMEKYTEELFNICKTNKIDTLIPIIDEEIEYFSKNKDRFKNIGVDICTPEYETVKLCRNKLLTFELIKNKIPEVYIKTQLFKNINKDNISYPSFAKPVSGRASIGCEKITDKITFEYINHKVDPSTFILQDFVEGEFYAVDFIREAKTKKFNCVARQELVRNKNGCGTVVKIVDDVNLKRYTKEIAEILNYNGVGNIEFIKQNDNYYMLEVNPRFPAGTAYTVMSGADFINDEIKIIKNREVDLKYDVKVNAIYTRRYETYEYTK